LAQPVGLRRLDQEHLRPVGAGGVEVRALVQERQAVGEVAIDADTGVVLPPGLPNAPDPVGHHVDRADQFLLHWQWRRGTLVADTPALVVPVFHGRPLQAWRPTDEGNKVPDRRTSMEGDTTTSARWGGGAGAVRFVDQVARDGPGEEGGSRSPRCSWS